MDSGSLVTQIPDDVGCGLSAIARVVDAVDHRHFGEIEGANAFETGSVDAVVIRIRAAAMMRVDAALRAEIMLGDARLELIERQRVLACEQGEIGDRHADGDRAAHAAEGTVAARAFETVR